MKILEVEIRDTHKNLTKQVSDQIRSLIQRKIINPGEKLPSLRSLANQTGLHYQTLKNAIDDLISEGWVESKERVGYFVSLEIPTGFYQSTKENIEKLKPFNFKPHFDLELPNFSPKQKLLYNFQSGLPDLRLLPAKELKVLYSDAISSNHLFGYSDPLGLPALRESMTRYLARVRHIQDKPIIITNGSQEALYMISRILLKKGDRVLMEDCSYAVALNTFKTCGANIEKIKNDFSIRELENKLKSASIKAIFLTPLHHFPTCSSINAPKRLQIYELCVKYQVFIIEDDYDHEIHFRPPLSPLASLDSRDQVIYLSTFSKALFPGLRVGFMALPKSLEKYVREYRRLTTHQNEILSQIVMNRFIESGGFEKHLRKCRRVYLQRRDIMVQELSQKFSFDIPDGGLALWVDTHQDSEKLHKRALSKGVFVTPECQYNGGKKGTHLRLGFSNQNEEEIKQGLKLLKKLL
ncbi:MAG: PLP-dependent aminotransferase family protein [Bdellovibrionales bacterium]|nr:PLP-dependent aminotransferase family protein [Bdellovibrionales bacterium]